MKASNEAVPFNASRITKGPSDVFKAGNIIGSAISTINKEKLIRRKVRTGMRFQEEIRAASALMTKQNPMTCSLSDTCEKIWMVMVGTERFTSEWA